MRHAITTLTAALFAAIATAAPAPVANQLWVTNKIAAATNATLAAAKAYTDAHGGGGGCDTNAVQALIEKNVQTNYLAAKSDLAGYLPLNGSKSMTGNLIIEGGSIYLGHDSGDARIEYEMAGAEMVLAGDVIHHVLRNNANDSPLTPDGSPVLTETLAKSTFPTVTNAYPLASGNALAATVQNWEDYWSGDRVRLSVTNYYGNTSGEMPRLRIEEFDHSTTNGTVVSNFYHVVWDEETRHTNYQASVDARVDAISNTVMTAAWMQTANQLAAKAPRAWGSVTSAGTQAPPDTVWMTEPNTVFAGGTEYAHVSCGEGTIAVLACKGAAVYSEGDAGVFRFQTDDGSYYFGFDIGTTYYIGCRTDGISTTQSGGDTLVTLTYDLTSSTNPIIYHTTNLTANATWEVATATWEQNPPAGTMICYLNAGSSPCGYYKAAIEHSGHTEFRTNMQANLMGGIVATNQSTNTMQPIEPYITTNNQGTAVISWRIKQ